MCIAIWVNNMSEVSERVDVDVVVAEDKERIGMVLSESVKV